MADLDKKAVGGGGKQEVSWSRVKGKWEVGNEVAECEQVLSHLQREKRIFGDCFFR